jgi:hypothetical protein
MMTYEQRKAAHLRTHRRILLGAYVEAKMKENSAYEAEVLVGLEQFLVRPSDRQKFGFEPLMEEQGKPSG